MAKLTYLGHASFLIESKDYSIVVDPYQYDSVPNMLFPKGIKANKVICSHDHFDHNAKENVEIIPTNKKINITTVSVPHDHEGGKKRGMNNINMFDVDGYIVVHLGDTGCVLDEKTLAPFKSCDVLLAPINGFFTINAKELKAICEIINPRIVIPMHYYMKEYQSGYPDGNMIEEFKKLFPNYQECQKEELDLDLFKNYKGALILKKYLQD